MIVSRSRTMHPQSHPLTIGGTWKCLTTLIYWEWRLIETFETHLRWVSWAGSQINGILRKSWQVLYGRFLLGRCFLAFVLPVLESCCSAVLGCRYTHSTTGPVQSVVQFDIAHRLSAAVLCMLYKVRCNPMDPFCGALPVPREPVRVTRGALVVHWYT